MSKVTDALKASVTYAQILRLFGPNANNRLKSPVRGVILVKNAKITRSKPL